MRPVETSTITFLDDPSTAARYLGESVGTHYSAALRAARAFSTHLAGKRESLLKEEYEGNGLRDFWRELLRSEKVRVGSPMVLRELSTSPSHYFRDFLDTAEAVYHMRYQDPAANGGKSVLKSEHAQCLSFLRNPDPSEQLSQFTIQNKVTTWMQLLRILGKYQE